METVVATNTYNPVLVLTNCLMEFFYIVSGFAAQFANFNYEDWFSFAYWAGDLFYRFMVADHKDEAREHFNYTG